MPKPVNQNSAVPGLRGTLNTSKIVLLVVAAAAPLSAVVGTVPLAFSIGTGPGVPGMFVFAGLVLLCFSVGYAAMSRQVVNAGGFYTYVSMGLGRVTAIGGGLVAVLSYAAMSMGLAAAFGYFAHLVGAAVGLDLPWLVWSGVALVVVGLMGYRQIDLSARVLWVLMAAEIGVLSVLDIGVIAHKGAAALPVVSMEPSTVFSGAAGVAMMFAFMSFIGFESAALYGEETRNPRRTVPVATYASVLVIAVFYALSSWVAVGAAGPDAIRQTASKELGNLFFTLSTNYVSELLTTAMQVLLVTSVFASMLALHNAANRYIYALGRERVLPGWVGHVHERHHSPHRASVVQTIVSGFVLAAFALTGLDPYLNLATGMLGIGTLGIVALQACAAAAVVSYFWRRSDRHWWRTLVAPGLGAIGLAVSVVLLVANFRLLVGTDNVIMDDLPVLLAVVALAGVGYGLWLRAKRPLQYAEIAAVQVREESVPAPPEAQLQEVSAADEH
jgi:amino acid transporter